MIGRWLVLIAIWVALWGDISVVNLITGLVMAAGLSALFPGSLRSPHRIRLIPAVSFFFYMLRSIVLASWTVITAVLFPNEQRRHAEVIRVSLTSTSKLVSAVTANTISLTPGTVIIAVDPEGHFLEIHVLGFFNTPEFHDHIHDHERRVAAFLVEKT
jgi:multicomponent Na+:H+ antiporter subunit E